MSSPTTTTEHTHSTTNATMIPQSLISIVQHHLHQLETEKNVKVLFAGDAGSRSYGWSSLRSDFDIHMIYCHHSTHYLTIQPIDTNIEYSKRVKIPRRHLLEQMERQRASLNKISKASSDDHNGGGDNGDKRKMTERFCCSSSSSSDSGDDDQKNERQSTNENQDDDSGEDNTDETLMDVLEEIELNIVGYELKSFLTLFSKSNPAMIHMLSAPVLYQSFRVSSTTAVNGDHDHMPFDFASRVTQLCHEDVSRRVIVQSLLDLARKNVQKYIVKLNATSKKAAAAAALNQQNNDTVGSEEKAPPPPHAQVVTRVRAKVYLYLLHHLLYVDYIYRRHDEHGNATPFPPLQFELLINDANVPDKIRSIVNHLLKLKTESVDGDEVYVPRYIELELFLFASWRQYYRFAFKMKRHFMQVAPLDKLFRQCLKLTDRELKEEAD